MTRLDREEFISVIKALTPEEKRLAVSLIPMSILEEEQDKRYETVSELLESLKEALEPYLNGSVNTYDGAMKIIDNVTSALYEGQKKLKEETHEQQGETGGSEKSSKECCTDHREEHKRCDATDGYSGDEAGVSVP